MRRFSIACRAVTALSIVALLAAASVASAGTLFFDADGATAGSGGATPGVWDNVTPNWSTSQTGNIATIIYIPGSDAVFSANAAAVSTAQTVSVVGTQFANSLSFNNAGIPTLAGSAGSSPALVLGLGGLILGGGSSTSGVRGAVTLDATLGVITLAGTQNFSNNSSSTALNALVVNAGVQGSGPGLTTLLVSSLPGGTNGTTGTTTFNGILSNGTGGGRLALTLNASGNLNTILTAANTFTGPINLNSGALQLNTATGSVNSAVAANFNATSNFTFNNIGAAAATSQTLSAVNFNQGEGGIIAVQTVAQDVQVTLGAVNRTTGAIGNFNLTGTPGTLTATNGIAITGQAAGFISQGLFFNGAVGGGGQNGQFAFYDTTINSVRGISYGVDANTATFGAGTSVPTGPSPAGGTNAFVQITGAQTAQGTDTFNTLNISGASNLALDVNATLTLANGGLLKTGNSAATISGGAGITAGAAELVIKNDQAADNLTISTAILASSTGGLTKGGLGILTLSSTGNAYSGTTTVNQGSLTLGASNVIPDASNVHIVGAQATAGGTGSSGGSLNLGVNSDTVGQVTMDGGGLFGTTGILTATGGYDLRRGVVNGLLGGTAGLTKNGLGVVLLNNANVNALASQPYTGPTTVNAGVLVVNNTSTVPGINSASQLVLGGGTINPVSITGSAANALTFASTLVNAGDSTINPSRAGASSSLPLQLNAITRNTGATVNFQPAGSITISTTNTATASGLLGGYATANLNEFARINGTAITTGATYTNTATPTNATNLDMTASVAPGADSTIGSIRFNTNVATPTLTLSGTLNTVDSGGILATANTQGNAQLITGSAITSNNGRDLIVHQYNPASPLTINSNIVDNGITPIGLTKTGPGTVILGGTNTFTGSVYLNNGILQLASATALNTTTPSAINFGSASGFLANGGFDAQGNSFSTPTLRMAGNNAAVAALSTANAFVGNPIVENASVTAATLTVGTTVGTGMYSGVIQDGVPSVGTAAALSLVKTGASTQVLGGANTYSGTTTINQGTLDVNNTAGTSGVIAATPAVTTGMLTNTTSIVVNTGGTLSISGSSAVTNRINDNVSVVFNGAGGPAVSFQTNGLSERNLIGAAVNPGIGPLTLQSSSIIDFGTGASTVAFANSSSQTWVGRLSVINWSGNPGTGKGIDQLYFGTNVTGLTASQALQVEFFSGPTTNTGDLGPGMMLSTGEIVPVPEPGTMALTCFLAVMMLGWSQRRRLAVLVSKG